jgi:hypothetical protein
MSEAAFSPLDEVRPDLPKELLAVLRRGLARDASVRTLTAIEMLDALQVDLSLERGRTSLCASLVRMRNVATPKRESRDRSVRLSAPARYSSETSVRALGSEGHKVAADAVVPIDEADPMTASGAAAAFPPTALEVAVKEIRDRARVRDTMASASDVTTALASRPSGMRSEVGGRRIGEAARRAPVFAHLEPVTEVAGVPSPISGMFRVRRAALRPILGLGAVAFAALGVALTMPSRAGHVTSPVPVFVGRPMPSAQTDVAAAVLSPSSRAPELPHSAPPTPKAAVEAEADDEGTGFGDASATPAPPAPPAPPAHSAPLAAGSQGVGSGRGILTLNASAREHRVYLDGVLIGEGQGPFDVACGPHAMRIGTRGEPRSINVACSK